MWTGDNKSIFKQVPWKFNLYFFINYFQSLKVSLAVRDLEIKKPLPKKWFLKLNMKSCII
ncbi:hypothetical protein CXF67_09465 [Psychroflexus sp. MES1-P1E]|nr:hypothetical protein CXF67_09465 [Psychroflexus sp. MES1-P1E]